MEYAWVWVPAWVPVSIIPRSNGSADPRIPRGSLDDELDLFHCAGGIAPVLLVDEIPTRVGLRVLEGDDDVDGVRVVGLPDVGGRGIGTGRDVRVVDGCDLDPGVVDVPQGRQH